MRHTHVVTIRLLTGVIVATAAVWVASSAATALPSLPSACPLPEATQSLAPLGCPPRPTTTTTRRSTTTTQLSTTTTQPQPPAPLRATYVGTITGDGGSQAQVTMRFSGDFGGVFADVSVGSGLVISCHGDQNVGMLEASMSGNRVGSTVSLGAERSGEISGVSAHLVLSVTGTLSSDSAMLSGPVHVHVGLPWYLGDCDSTWHFDVQSMSSEPAQTLAVVPDVIGQPLFDGLAGIRAAGLVPGFPHESIDSSCNNLGNIVGLSPSAGAALLPGSPVDFWVAVEPPPPSVCP
jgi:hypothetical protein